MLPIFSKFLFLLLPFSLSWVQEYEVNFGEIAAATGQLELEDVLVARKENSSIWYPMIIWKCKNKGKHIMKLCRPLFFSGTNLHFEVDSHNFLLVSFVH